MEQYIHPEMICCSYHIDRSFISLLQEHELIELHVIEEQEYIHVEQLALIEKYIHLHYDLEINLPGIEVITHLLQKIAQLQDQNRMLQNMQRSH